MRAFPPVLPDPALRFSTRLPRDHYVRVDTNDYSVNPRFVGRRIEVGSTWTRWWPPARDRGGPPPALSGQAPHPPDPTHAMTLRPMRAEQAAPVRSPSRSKSGTWPTTTKALGVA